MERYQAMFLNFDTINTITIYHTNRVPLMKAQQICGHCESLFSRFQAGSDIWRVNHAQGAPVEVDGKTIDVISRAIACTEATGGAFDITVGALSGLWDFSGRETPPSRERLLRRAELVGAGQIEIKGRTVRVPPGVQLDLGGIAKGYVTDLLVELMRAEGVRSGIINLGGNLFLLGRKPDGSLWKAGLQRPVEDSCQWVDTVEAEDVSIVTSGIYERGYDQGEQHLHHILDPGTGLPSASDLAAVSVICANSTEADAYSTAFLCLGVERTKNALAHMSNVKAFLQRKDGIAEWCGTA